MPDQDQTPIRAATVDGRRFYRPSDALRLLGWLDLRRVDRQFPTTRNKKVVAAVLKQLPKAVGRPAGWVVEADAVDQWPEDVRSTRGRMEAADQSASDPGPYTVFPEGRSSGSEVADAKRIDDLRRQVAELEGAYGDALESRERLLAQVEALHRLGIEQVATQRTLLREMRNFSIATFPEG